MPRFFIDPAYGDEIVISGQNASHISRSLRMTCGEELVLCDGKGTDYFCTISEITSDTVTAHIDCAQPSQGEPDVEVLLFQGLPKSDKMDLIVQKAVELGVNSVIPFLATRSISRPDDKSASKKADRWQKIASEAAMQSHRGIIPQVLPVTSFADSLKMASECDCIIVFYEGGGLSLGGILSPKPSRVAIFIGPEGGLDESDVAAIEAIGGKRATLGKRILRTETAPLAAITSIMLLTDNMN